MSEDSSGPDQPTNNDDSRDEVLRKRSFSRARGIDISSFMVTDDESESEPVETSQEVSQEPDIAMGEITEIFSRGGNDSTGPGRYKQTVP